MADNYLERRREDYEARKAAWLKSKKRKRASHPDDGSEMLHFFTASTEGIELPMKFTNPFDYQPHPLCILAAGEVQRYLAEQAEWKEELDKGKMFGVLVVRTREGRLGFLAAFSGTLNGTNRLPDGCSIDWITCSPKYRPVNLNRIDELKVVFMGASQDMSRYDGMEASVYSLQPCDTGDGKANARILEETIAYCLANPKWRLSLQTHKIINVR